MQMPVAFDIHGQDLKSQLWNGVSRLGTSELHLCFLLITSSAGFFGP